MRIRILDLRLFAGLRLGAKMSLSRPIHKVQLNSNGVINSVADYMLVLSQTFVYSIV